MDALFAVLAPLAWCSVPALAAWFYHGARREDLSAYLATGALCGVIILLMIRSI